MDTRFDFLFRRLRLLIDIPIFYWKSTTIHGFHPAAAASMLFKTLLQGFWPSEAYRLGLLHPVHSASLQAFYISKRSMVRVQRRMNPAVWEAVVSDKEIFGRLCQAFAIPTPQTRGVFYRNHAGWGMHRPILKTNEDWESFFVDVCPDHIVIKPARGHHGVGIMFVERRGTDFILSDGQEYTAASLVMRLRSDPEAQRFIIQERLRNHPAIASISSGHGLATSRFLTFVDKSGLSDIVYSDFKIPAGTNLTSNFSMGTTGNLVAVPLMENGRLERVYTITPGIGYVDIDKHPDTHARIVGFQMPFWKEACELVKNAAIKFLPVRTIGWDVAYTEKGPVIIEGNFWYDPPGSPTRAQAMVASMLHRSTEIARREESIWSTS